MRFGIESKVKEKLTRADLDIYSLSSLSVAKAESSSAWLRAAILRSISHDTIQLAARQGSQLGARLQASISSNEEVLIITFILMTDVRKQSI